jgi:hypothetical protein
VKRNNRITEMKIPHFSRYFLPVMLLLFLATGCNSIITTPAETSLLAETATLFVATETPLPPTSTPTPLPSPTAPALSPVYQSSQLNHLDQPYSYIADTCQALLYRLDPNHAAPGTIIMPIMIHSITDGPVNYADQISVQDFHNLWEMLHNYGFQAISTQQLADFLERNAPIPPLSVMFIVDDRKSAEYFNTLFRPLYEQYGWVVVNAWISAEGTTEQLWNENAALSAEGWLDHQAHGVVHNIPINPNSSDEFILSELQGSITAIQSHFGISPIAYIWPGGGFTPRAAELARQAGYRLGFTINPRGPLMFNWIPLSAENDPNRPSYIPEATVNDPLMVLPRYWDTDAIVHIPTVVAISQEAAAYAQANYTIELAYYQSACEPSLGPIPTLNP